MKLRIIIPFLALGLGAVVWTACKQGEGDRCQIDDDCKSDLVCNKATLVCADLGATKPFDAEVPIDAPDAALDAFVIDGP